MIESDRTDFGTNVASALSVYKQDATELLLEAWWSVLQPYKLPAVVAALQLHLADVERGHFPPTPADVRRHLEITLPKQAQAKCRAIIGDAELRAGKVRERMNQLITDVRIKRKVREDVQPEFDRLQLELGTILHDETVLAARRGLQLREDRSADDLERMPVAVRKAMAMIGRPQQ